MKIKHGFVLRRVLDEAIVVASGEASKTFHGMIKLNDSAADIWQWISEGKGEAEIAKLLGVSEAHVNSLFCELQNAGYENIFMMYENGETED